MDWFRSHHGAPTDPKWLVIASKAQSKPGIVAAVWWALLDHASQNTPRGSVAGFDTETLAAFWGFGEAEIVRIVAALRDKKLVGSDDIITTWAKRQPKKEDGAAERARAWRERMKEQDERERTQANAGEHRTEQRRGEETERDGAANESPPPKVEKRKRKTQLPDDWKPNDAHRQQAVSMLGVSVEREAEAFRDHAKATGRTMLDWDAAFRTWLRKAQEFRKPQHGTPAAQVRDEQPGQGRSQVADLTRLIQQKEADELARDKERAAKVDAWSRSHEDEAAALWSDVQREVGENAMILPKMKARTAEALYRQRVLERIGETAA